MGRRHLMHCDPDYAYDALVIERIEEARRRREALYDVLRAGHAAYPQNRDLRKKWIRAKLALGDSQPKVKLSLEQTATFPRTTAEATRRGFETLAPRTMREAGIH